MIQMMIFGKMDVRRETRSEFNPGTCAPRARAHTTTDSLNFRL